MFQKTLASLVLTVGLIHPSIASEIVQFPTHLFCLDQETLTSTITEFEEIPFAGGVATREVAGAGMVTNNLVIFVNPKTKTWTIVERFSKDLYCVISIGDGFRPLGVK